MTPCCFSGRLQGGGRGVRPAAHLLSFASPKESRQRKGDPQSASPFLPVGRKGATCDARSWGGVAELAARGLWPRSAQTTATSQITKCVCPAAHAPTPRPALLGAASRGGDRALHGCCLGSCGWGQFALRAADATGAMALPRPRRSEAARAERSNGPCGAPNPFWTCREAQELGWRVCRRTHALRHLTRRRCLSGVHPQGERSELRGAPQLRASQVARSEAKGHGQQGRLSFGYFSLAKQRTSTSAAGPRPGSHP